MKRFSLYLLTTLLFISSVVSQGTLSDYQRAEQVKKNFSHSKIKNTVHNVQWITDSLFIYQCNSFDGPEYYQVNCIEKQKKLLFDVNQLLTQLNNQKDVKPIKRESLFLERLKWDIKENKEVVSFNIQGKKWHYNLRTQQLTEEKQPPKKTNHRTRHWMERDEEMSAPPMLSPDGTISAFVKDNNIFIKNTASGEERQLSFDGLKENYYSSYILWSSDSKKIAVNQIKPTSKRFVHYVESSPKDQLQPKLHTQEYTKPGDPLPFYTPCIFNIEEGKKTEADTHLIASQYAISRLMWNKDDTGITFEFNERGHQTYRVLELLENSPSPRILVEEKSNTFVNYTRYFRYDLEEKEEMIWMSERDNWNHLYLIDKKKGKVKNQITKGAWYVREVLHIDEKKQEIYFMANGMVQDEDPYLKRLYKIKFNGKNLTCLTPDKGMHSVHFSPDYSSFIDTYSTTYQPPVSVLRNSKNGRVIMELEQSDISELKKVGWKAPEVFVAKGRDNETDMWGIIIRPTNFDPNKKYPIIEYIYAGPGSHYVPKSFQSYYSEMTSLAELGFIVVQLDAMGTSFRSKSFEEICHKNLKDAGFPDRMAWIKSAANQYPYMDIENVGIFGCSAGGQESTAAVLFHPDFYKAAYSACGCHDNRMDKIWWNELWMGYPIDNSYSECSNIENAHLLTRPLMLLVGEMDDNVDPASTYQLANKLIKHNKEFELIVLPGERHTMGGLYGEHKRYDFFVRHLLKKDPPVWSLLEQNK